MMMIMMMMLPEAQGQYKDTVVITLARVGGGIRKVSRADLIKIAPGVLILVMEALTGGRVTPDHHEIIIIIIIIIVISPADHVLCPD